ncbi:MAG: ABC transporter ATP-binding protein [Chloroflexi bacterium]|nr:ABC transporter ATP-binding protein [Chloroflexota bacterium]
MALELSPEKLAEGQQSRASVVRARALTKRYGDFEAVKGIDFDVWRQECFGVLGPNGAGKTTTMKMVHCASPVTSGELLVAGLDVMRFPRQVKALLGVVPQSDNLDPDLTVRQNLLVYARYFDIAAAEAQTRSDDLLDLFQLTEKASAKVSELSGGMKRRLVIARGLLNQPEVLLLDEPTTGLDPQARHLVWQKVSLLKEQGTTLMLTTHYMDEAARLCDRLVIMHHGQILAEGSPRDLIERHAGREVLEVHGDAARRDTIRASLGADVATIEVEDQLFLFAPDPAEVRRRLGLERDFLQRASTLEDVFLRLTGGRLQEDASG